MTTSPTSFAARRTLEPIAMQEGDGMQQVHEDWRHAIYLHHPCDGLYINCINGCPGGIWQFDSSGAAALSLNILLQGRMETGFDDDSSGIQACAETAVVMATEHRTGGWNVLDSQTRGVFRMVSIHLPQATLAHVTGLDMDSLLSNLRSPASHTGHVHDGDGAILAAMPASASLRRAATELLTLGCRPAPGRASHALQLRAQALQAIACFMHHHVEARYSRLSAPADRPRLHAARALLEKHYAQSWTVDTLACSVGLSEKRLQAGFRALYGNSVHACLTHIRLDAAAIMLQNGASVTETAACCGFASQSHFSRAFRRYTGMSPRCHGSGAHAMAQ